MPKRKTNGQKKWDKAKTQYHQRASLRNQIRDAKSWQESSKLYKRLGAIQK